MVTQQREAPALEDLVKIEDTLESFIPSLHQLLEQGEAHERHLRDQANAQRTENVRIRGILKKAEGDSEPKPKRKASSGKTISQNRLDHLRAYFHKYKDREVTSKELNDHFNWAVGQVTTGVRMLRANEEIRFVGKRDRTKAYRLMD